MFIFLILCSRYTYIYIYIYLCIYLSIYLSIYPSTYITTNVNVPHPTPTLQLRSIATCVHITTNVNMPHPTPTLQLRSIATCVHITTNTNMPHPKNNNPRGGGESAAYLKQLTISRRCVNKNKTIAEKKTAVEWVNYVWSLVKWFPEGCH